MQETHPPVWLRHPDVWIGLGLFSAVLALYLATLAPGVVFGDPAEYVFVPHVWGVIHPPGYAFYTLLSGAFQRVVPFGSVAWRVNLLSAVAGAGIAALVYGSVRTLAPQGLRGPLVHLPGLFAGASAAVATDIWQHSIHANAHIITTLLATLSVFLLLRWRQDGREGWLYAFCVVAGLSVTHHPLLVFGFPAYAAFIVVERPGVWREWRTLLKMIGFALLGMSVWLYFPIRSALPAPPPFGPGNMNTLDGFLDLVLARGLRVNLFHFGLADQPDRLLVFRELLGLQFSLVTIALMVVGLAYLAMRDRHAALLFGAFLLVNLAFILNTIQDVMAYLMVPFAALAMLAGVGVLAVLEGLRAELEAGKRWGVALAVLLMALPISRAAWLSGRVSLRGQDEAAAWVEAVFTHFDGAGEGALLLADWEHLTPLWYAQYVEGRALDEADVMLVYVATTSERPWVDNVWVHIEEGPIYLSGYRREVIEEGFRLRPEGPLYRVVPPPATQPPDITTRLDADAGPVAVVGYDLPQREVTPGEVIPLTLYLTADQTPPDIIFPYTTLGEVRFEYTTDSHYLSPWWEPGEIIAERFDLRAPLDIEAGAYPVQLGLRNLSQGEELRFDGDQTLSLGEVTVGGVPQAPPVGLMADIGHRVGLVRASARAGWRTRKAVWSDPLVVRPGDSIHVRLTWRALAPPDDNWKVFVHLIDAANQPIAQQDNPPLGGAFPTYLWFPKWVPGQQVVDPYRLVVPPGTPPGEYALEVGMYSFTGLQRAPFFDAEGNLSGDRFILGPVRVEP